MTVPTKPRLAESADGLWEELNRLDSGYVLNGRILYLIIRMVCGGGEYRIGHEIERVDVIGMTCRKATESEIEELHNDLETDRLEVVIYSQAGYASDYAQPKVLKILHSPSGNSWE